MDKAFIKARRAVGIQAQRVPRPISNPEKKVLSQLSYEMFCELANVVSDLRRRMLMTVTLERGAKCQRRLVSSIRRRTEDPTYSVPTQNIRVTPSFFFQLSFSPRSLLSGIASIQRSRVMPTMALAQPIALKFTQVP